jgi:hypothetical protein
MSYNNTLFDGRGIPLSSVIVPGNTTPVPLKGGNSATDNVGNTEASVCVVRDATTVLNQVSAAQTANGNAAGLAVGPFCELAVDINITASSGTSPTIQFFVDRLGADGTTYFTIWSSSVINTSPTVVSTAIGAGLSVAQSFGAMARFRWVVTGTTPSFTFSASIVGK